MLEWIPKKKTTAVLRFLQTRHYCTPLKVLRGLQDIILNSDSFISVLCKYKKRQGILMIAVYNLGAVVTIADRCMSSSLIASFFKATLLRLLKYDLLDWNKL